MNPLAKEVILKQVEAVKPGTFIRIGYRTELPVKAAYKKSGIQFFKYTEVSLRLGVNYGNIASVIARKAEERLVETVQRANNYECVIPNKVRRNTATNKDYIFCANFNEGANIHNVYVGTDNGEVFSVIPDDKDAFKKLNEEYMIPSYWKNDGCAPEVMNISFSNIYRIGGEGLKFAEVVDYFIEEFKVAAGV